MRLTTKKPQLIFKLAASLCAFTLLAPVTVLAADGLSYSYLQVGYVNLNIDEVGDSGSLLDDIDNGGGWAASGSYAISPNWFAFSQYSVTDSDVSFTDDQSLSFNSNTDINRLDLGFGFHSAISKTTDLVFRVAYTDVDTDGFNFGGSSDTSLNDLNDDSSDGYFADAAIRSQFNERMEGSLGLRYTDLEHIDNLSFISNVMYEFSPNVGLNFSLEAGNDISSFLIGLRYSF